MIKSVEELLRISETDVKKHILETLDEERFEVPAVLLDQVFPSLNPFLGLKTEYQQTKFYRENFNLIVSCS